MGASASRQAVPSPHRSLNCRTATTVEFVNDTEHQVTTVWLDYAGNRRSYVTLQPGGRARQPTFTAHPWTFVAEDDPLAILVVNDQPVYYAPAQQGSGPVEAHICLPSPLPWCPDHHLCFPPGFRAQVSALLCCHRRLSDAASSPPLERQQQPLQPLQQLPWRIKLQRRLRRLRQCCPINALFRAPQMAAQAGCFGVAARTRGDSTMTLGYLPKDVLLEVLVAAAPNTPMLAKPPLPHGVQRWELPPEVLQELFDTGDNLAPGSRPGTSIYGSIREDAG